MTRRALDRLPIGTVIRYQRGWPLMRIVRRTLTTVELVRLNQSPAPSLIVHAPGTQRRVEVVK